MKCQVHKLMKGESKCPLPADITVDAQAKDKNGAAVGKVKSWALCDGHVTVFVMRLRQAVPGLEVEAEYTDGTKEKLL
jgi:hypothetical protein